MTEQAPDTVALRSAIKFWLDVSKYFYRSFRLKRYLGPQWFLVNILALHTSKSVSVRELLRTMPPQTKKGSNAQVELSACLEDLRNARYLELTVRGRPAQPKNSSFAVETTITRLQKLQDRATKYVMLLLERTIDGEYARTNADRAAEILRVFFDFCLDTLVRPWEDMLQDL